MKSGDRSLESVVVLYLSLFFLVASTLALGPAKSLVGLKFSQILVVSSIIALALSYPLRKKMHGSLISSPDTDSNFKSDALIVILLYSSALAVLAIRATLEWSFIPHDEAYHLRFPIRIYEALDRLDYDTLVSYARVNVNPIFPYLLTVALVPYPYFSIFSARLFAMTTSSLVPIVLYFLVKENGVDYRLSALTAFALSFSSLFQSQAYHYTFDGLSTLLFTVAFYFLVKAMRNQKKINLVLSSIFFYLLVVTKYPPAVWLVLIYIPTTVFLMTKKNWSVNNVLPLIVTIASSLPLAFCMFLLSPNIFSRLLVEIFFGWNKLTIPYAVATLWDLVFILGWSPYLIIVFVAYRYLRSREKNEIIFVSLLAIMLAFLTLVPYLPVTRRIIQAIPVFFATTVSYSYGRYPSKVVALILLNLSWWGALTLIT